MVAAKKSTTVKSTAGGRAKSMGKALKKTPKKGTGTPNPRAY